MQTKIILIPLFKDREVSTGGNDQPVYYDLDIARFKAILPYAVSLTLYTLTVGAPSANEFEWNVVFNSGFDRDHEITAGSPSFKLLGTNISANGPGKSATPYTTLANFMLESRLAIMAKNKDMLSGVRTARCSAVLAVETVGM
jgi:hypothetical protein